MSSRDSKIKYRNSEKGKATAAAYRRRPEVIEKKRNRDLGRPKLSPEQRERANKLSRDRYAKNPKLVNATCIAWRKLNKSKVKETNRRNHLRRNYQLSPEDFERLFTRAEGKCEICGMTLQTGAYRRDVACVDHDHGTGKVRGILCLLCNAALGKFGDSSATLERALQYLNRELDGF